MSASRTSRFARYTTILLRWLSIVAVVFIPTVFAGVYVIDNVLPKLYMASAQIQVQPRVADATGSSPPPAPQLRDEMETLRSPEILLSVIKDLGLDKTWQQQVYELDEDRLPDVDALTRIKTMLRIDLNRGTNIVKISVSSSVPEEAAAIANAVADRYKALREQSEALLHAPNGPCKNPVRILSRAEPPLEPYKPNKPFDYNATVVAAGLLGIMLASFVEIIFLFLRASEAETN